MSSDAAWDPTHTAGPHANHWTSTNLGEAAPGVLTPLATAHWGIAIHRAAMRAVHAMGVVSRAERERDVPAAERATRLFHGRVTARLEYLTLIGDRMPGVTGQEVLRSLLGEPLDSIEYHPTARRYPIIAARAAREFRICHPRVNAMAARTDAWWREHVAAVPHMDEAALIRAVGAGARCYEHAIGVHVMALFASVQPVYDMLDRLIAGAGVGDISVLSGGGGAEMAVVGDLWRASRGDMRLDEVVANHGFHGPSEGEVSSAVWRENPDPLHTVVAHYRDMPDADSPMALDAAKETRRVAMTAELLAALPAHKRAGAGLVLRLARERVPERGRGKRSFLQGIDVTRMAARQLGSRWADRGVLAHPDDTFFLTAEEIAAPLPADVPDLVARRRERRAFYETIEFRDLYWRGEPEMTPIGRTGEVLRPGDTLQGTGASRGVVEGAVRVVTDPTFEDVEPGEILVAKTTDPSWCSIMFVSAALVVDMGGALSHAAVVARELEIPCVVNTGDGTRRLQTGDRVRVDGDAGTIRLIER